MCLLSALCVFPFAYLPLCAFIDQLGVFQTEAWSPRVLCGQGVGRVAHSDNVCHLIAVFAGINIWYN